MESENIWTWGSVCLICTPQVVFAEQCSTQYGTFKTTLFVRDVCFLRYRYQWVIEIDVEFQLQHTDVVSIIIILVKRH